MNQKKDINWFEVWFNNELQKAQGKKPTANKKSHVRNSQTTDNINPQHYKRGKVECIDAIEAATVGKTGIEAVCVANIIKYLWRYEKKNGIEDVQKCEWYLNKLIEVLKSKQ